jgi:Ca-activated chloride channel family protein
MRKPATSRLLAVLLISVCGLWAQQSAPSPNAAPQSPGQRQSEPETTLKVDVNLVNVFVTVTDEHGAPVGGLTKENFVLKEDDRDQLIKVFDRESALPLSIALGIDTSLSTRHDLPLEQASAKRFAHEIVRPVDGLSVYSFSEVVHESAAGYTSDLKRIDESIDHIRVGAATALYDAIYLASRELENRDGRHVMVIVTDGGDTTSVKDFHQALEAAQLADALLYPVLVVPITNDAGRNIGGENALTSLASGTGGRVFLPTLGAELDRAFSDILHELRTQYMVGFYPKDVPLTKDRFHALKVGVQGRNLRALTRSGYYGESIGPSKGSGR